MLTTTLSSLLLLSTAAVALPQFGPIKPPCDQRVSALAAGIHLNIQGQYAEYNSTLAVEHVETATPADREAFLIAKGQLESVIQAGQNIRLTNQQIAPPGNPAIPGLQKYEMAQRVEKGLAMGLMGTYAQDKSAIDSLKMDIKQGIQLNEDNLKNAASECYFFVKFPPADEQGN